MPGIIYALFSNAHNKVYIGSTDRGDSTYLPQRLAEHVYNWGHPVRNRCSSKEIQDNNAIVNITALEQVLGGKLDTKVREQHWIDDYKRRGFTVVNKYKPINKALYELLAPMVEPGVPFRERLAGGNLPA